MLVVGLGAMMAAVALFGPLRGYVICVAGPPYEPDVCPLDAEKREIRQRDRLRGIVVCALIAGCCWYIARMMAPT